MEILQAAKLRRQQGATAIEYALIVGILAVILVAAFTALGGGIDDAFKTIVDTITGDGGGGSGA